MDRTADAPGKPAPWRTRTGVAVIGFALVIAFYALREHWGHALGVLPYLLLLACPLLHLFVHGGHGGHHHDETRDDAARSGRDGVP